MGLALHLRELVNKQMTQNCVKKSCFQWKPHWHLLPCSIPEALCTKHSPKEQPLLGSVPALLRTNCTWEKDAALCPSSSQLFLTALCIQIPSAPAGSALASSSAGNPSVSILQESHIYSYRQETKLQAGPWKDGILLPTSVVLIASLNSFSRLQP